MPFMPSFDVASMDNGGSATGALAAVMAMVMDRAKHLTASSEPTSQRTEFLFPENTRIPVSEVESISTPRRRKRSTGKKKNSSGVLVEKYDRSDNSVPQLITESIPIVHDRLPDPKMWEKLKLGQDEVDIQEIIDTARNPTQPALDGEFITTEKDILQHQTVHNLSKRSIPARLEGIARRNQLYCRNGYHLEILPDGKVQGTREDHSRFGILEFVATQVGRVTIRGVETGLYLSMDGKGRLYGSEYISRNSFFWENFEDNRYNTYSAVRYRSHSKPRSCYIAITQQGHARPGCRSKKSQKFTHFLPRPVESTKNRWQSEGELY